ncbi:FadR family transcriptional regulator [Salicibibacter halophilus]|uniref:FadR family transcriptional regulator n=1 Tax=Salicibibacter halophilus TaxID=2502791 RepID=A0A514LKM8_9BACI|nr:FadR/GntR family transcriptional regulator [Salicibibacter halophilus]QDI92418.1 FadR family transcriptional regulator [Salicibibacter halophilus]
MNYKQIHSKKIYEKVADEIKGRIDNGALQPGDRLDSVERLAHQFDVGRSAVREALSALKAIGLVDIRHGEGTFIKAMNRLTINPEEIRELLEVRKILEVGAAGSAARRCPKKQLPIIEKALHQMAVPLRDEKLGEEADWQFHLAIAHATQNNMLTDLLENIAQKTKQTMLETRRIWLFSEKVRAERLYEQHVCIYEAIKVGDATLAQQRMREHLESVENVLFWEETEKGY